MQTDTVICGYYCSTCVTLWDEHCQHISWSWSCPFISYLFYAFHTCAFLAL